jgi:large subunit ribosomal protein L33
MPSGHAPGRHWRRAAVAKAKGDRIIINLACTECRKYRYTSEKNRRNDTDRMQLRKFCPRCREHRPFRETR